MPRKEFQVFVSHFLRIGLFGSLAPLLPSGLMAGKEGLCNSFHVAEIRLVCNKNDNHLL